MKISYQLTDHVRRSSDNPVDVMDARCTLRRFRGRFFSIGSISRPEYLRIRRLPPRGFRSTGHRKQIHVTFPATLSGDMVLVTDIRGSDKINILWPRACACLLGAGAFKIQDEILTPLTPPVGGASLDPPVCRAKCALIHALRGKLKRSDRLGRRGGLRSGI